MQSSHKKHSVPCFSPERVMIWGLKLLDCYHFNPDSYFCVTKKEKKKEKKKGVHWLAKVPDSLLTRT